MVYFNDEDAVDEEPQPGFSGQNAVILFICAVLTKH